MASERVRRCSVAEVAMEFCCWQMVQEFICIPFSSGWRVYLGIAGGIISVGLGE